MRFIACGASVIGPRHVDLGEPNQDAMVLAGCRGGWIAAAADGLGSRARSDLGSRSACQVARRILRATSSSFDLPATLPLIHQQWLEAIDPTTPRDAATTLLFGRVTDQGEVHAAQLGDGLLLVRCAGEFRRVTPERTAYGNQTWALESMHLQDKWNCTRGRFTETGDGVVLMTDGVADDLESAHLADFFDALYQDLSARNRRRGRRWLQSELNDWATPLHSDDKTLVAIFRTSE
ncbi:PP2C family serine/threonine-protein phosphatase [Thauera aromatica]|uniref:Protein phosphatase 2C domain-containing protein n=1 Tax=Thauera aromatica K172 TaxID=44139 RepID=A0A2R4BK01_THAAR|nr:PP2C family serine/threonine-protein phosphatase [Thauera aromatica]AVR87534.1 protein phosphatase 2C domain-containing protein [Thauera aromatica K172]